MILLSLWMYCEVRVKSQPRQGLGEEGVYSCVEERTKYKEEHNILTPVPHISQPRQFN